MAWTQFGATLVFAACLLWAGRADAAPSTAPTDVSKIFGSRVVKNPLSKVPFLTGDFDGDGVPDTLCLVTIKPASAQASFAKDVTLVENLFNGTPIGGHSEKLAVAIVLGKDKRKFLLTAYGNGNSGFFDTPIWGTEPLPLDVAKRGSDQFKEFARGEKRIKDDVITVFTEAGIDTAVYWDGKKFDHYWPAEEP
jgi:hypothetical protein